MATEGILAPGGRVIPDMMHGAVLPLAAHAGLVFDRYLAVWEDLESTPRIRKPLLEPLQRFVDDFNGRQDGEISQRLLDRVQQRLDRALGRYGYQQIVYCTSWRLATGLGAEHPIENGFVFDPLLGVPVLAGSGIKGLCRQAADVQGFDENRVEELFGPENPEVDGAKQGDLIFLDAYPDRWPKLCVDIINSHYRGYYRELEQTDRKRDTLPPPPSETESPVPVFFLAVDAGSGFVFRVGSQTRSADKVTQGLDLLEFGLGTLGFGAKTAVGYGVLNKQKESEEKGTITNPSPLVDQMISDIVRRNRSSEEETLRGRQLAQAWSALPEGPEKKAAHAEIRRRWQARGWWGQPRGKAMQYAYSIYTGYHEGD